MEGFQIQPESALKRKEIGRRKQLELNIQKRVHFCFEKSWLLPCVPQKCEYILSKKRNGVLELIGSA